MDANDNWLLWHRLEDLAARVRGATDEAEAGAVWSEMEAQLAAAEAEEDIDVAMPVLEQSLADLEALFRGWADGTRPLAAWDKAVLQRAGKAFRKRLKLVRLDDESSASRNPLSRGEGSAITGVRPPEQYPPRVWATMVQLGKLRDAGHGLLELP